HTLAPSSAETDWARIVAIYDQLRAIDPSPVLALARAVALGRARGPAEGLAALPVPNGNPYGHAAIAIFLTELGRTDEARAHYEKARNLARTEPERRLLERRLKF
ncbi:MAG: RNA polymerase subunit sigma-24, partial [Enhydrobacter sp.]